MPTVGLLIHVPKLTEQYRDNIFLQMRALLDLCEDVLQLVEEEWYVVNDHSSFTPTWKYTADERLRWHLDVEEMQDRCCRVSAKAGFAMKQVNPRTMSLNATIMNSAKGKTLTQIKGECTLDGVIDKYVWDQIDQPKFIAAVQNACSILGATYASIDYEINCPKSLYSTNYRLFSKNVPIHYYGKEADYSQYPEVDPETYLPGVYWAQLVPQSMVEATGTLKAIAAEAPCETKELINMNGTEYIWLQLTPNLWKTKLDKRLRLRRYFQKSLLKLDIERLAEANHPILFSQINFLPLEEEEARQAEARRRAIYNDTQEP